jgi:hypothetical protein
VIYLATLSEIVAPERTKYKPTTNQPNNSYTNIRRRKGKFFSTVVFGSKKNNTAAASSEQVSGNFKELLAR